MSKFTKTIDKIELNQQDKEKILNTILNNKKEKTFYFKTFMIRFATFIIGFVLLSSSVYALAKVFHFDEKFKEWFSMSDEELISKGVTGNDVNIKKEFSDAIITINQTVLDEKEIYIMIEIVGKEKNIGIEEAHLSLGNTFEENIDDENSDKCNKTFGCYSEGFGLIKEEEKLNGYALNFSIDKKLQQTQLVTLRLISNETYYDITFSLQKNEIKSKKINCNKIVYNEKNVTATVKEFQITPFRIIMNLQFNKEENSLTDKEQESILKTIFNDDMSNQAYVTFTDGSTQEIKFEGRNLNTVEATFGKNEEAIIDIDTIKSITINQIDFTIK